LLVHRWQDDEALFVLLGEAIQRLVLILVEAHFLACARQVKAEGWVTDHHLEGYLSYFEHELADLRSRRMVSVLNSQRVLDHLCHAACEMFRDAHVQDAAPVALVCLAKHACHMVIQKWSACYCFNHLLSGCKVAHYGRHNRLEEVLEEEDDTFDVQLGTKQVEKDILAVALVEL